MAQITLAKFRGAIALVGDDIDALVQNALQSAALQTPDFSVLQYDTSFGYHITLLPKAEIRSVAEEKVSELLQPGKVDARHLNYAGVGGNRDAGVLYLVIIWAAGQQLRKHLGLPPKHFHITLTRKDDHDMNKGISSLFPGQLPAAPSFSFLDHLAFTLHCFCDYNGAQAYSVQMVASTPGSPKGFLRLADAASANGLFKLAMLSYGCAYDRADDAKARAYCLKNLIACSAHTEWGAVFQEAEIPQIPTNIGYLLCRSLVQGSAPSFGR